MRHGISKKRAGTAKTVPATKFAKTGVLDHPFDHRHRLGSGLQGVENVRAVEHLDLTNLLSQFTLSRDSCGFPSVIQGEREPSNFRIHAESISHPTRFPTLAGAR